MCFDDKITRVLKNTYTGKVMTIGIAGGSGAAKSTISDEIKRIAGAENVFILSSDNFYKDLIDKPLEERAQTNFDHPSSIDFTELAQAIIKLKNFEEIEIPEYDFETHTRKKEKIKILPKHVIIVEGILIYAIPEIRNKLDIRFFVDTDSDERFVRRLTRDIEERGRTMESVRYQWRITVKPMHDQYVEPSMIHAHIIIPSRFNEGYKILFSLLTPFICSWLKQFE